ITDDDRLAAAVVKPRERVLVGHGAGQVQHVGQRRILAGVGVKARAAERGTERGRVDGDDRPEAAGPVLAEDDLLVSVLIARASAVQSRRLGIVGLVGHTKYVDHGTVSWFGSRRR